MIRKYLFPHKVIPPIKQVRRLYQAALEFIRLEVSGGIFLMAAALVALVWANSPWKGTYAALWHIPLSVGLGSGILAHDLHWWINDGLMALFFLVVGLEIKREILVGELSSARQAVLPVAAALGGMLAPALIYLLVNLGKPGIAGWGIPMATDIAFALGVMALVGSRLPISLKIFLTALAIVDDIGAVLVIALFYTGQLSQGYLVLAGGILLVLLLTSWLGIRNLLVYLLLGFCLWLAIIQTGIHATVAGVLLAFFIPASRKIQSQDFLWQAGQAIEDFRQAGYDDPRHLTDHQQGALQELENVLEKTQAPLQRLEHDLHPWVTYGIIPLFALANAGVTFPADLASIFWNPISLGITIGLVLGKQFGISLAAWLAVKLGITSLPEGTSWREIYAISWLGGIGFTMSLFIAELAFADEELLEAAKFGILAASMVAGLLGFALLSLFFRGRKGSG